MTRVAGLKWLGVAISTGALVSVLITGLNYVFATRADLVQVEKSQLLLKSESKLRDYRIRRLEVQAENIEAITRRTDTNVEKLLSAQRLKPAPDATIKPLPYMPFDGELGMGD